MWFYINLHYFPYNAQYLAQKSFDEFYSDLRRVLTSVRSDPSANSKEPAESKPTETKPVDQACELPEYVSCLHEQKVFDRFKDILASQSADSIDQIVSNLTEDLEALSATNKEALNEIWDRFVGAYAKAKQQAELIETGQITRDPFPYKATDLDSYG